MASTLRTGLCPGATGGSAAASDHGEVTLRVALIEEINRQLRVGDGLLARLKGSRRGTPHAGAPGPHRGDMEPSLDRLRNA